jgi:hypothetical protein
MFYNCIKQSVDSIKNSKSNFLIEYRNSFFVGFDSTSYAGFGLIGEVFFPPGLKGSWNLD